MDCIEKQFLIKKAKELYPSWMESGHKEIKGRLPPITREDLLSLFQEKSQELGQSQRADERGRK